MEQKIDLLNHETWLKNIQNQVKSEKFNSYYAMYSSWFGGIVTKPDLMMIPMDDHLVHRSDGIFEAIKCIKGKFYLIEDHLTRLRYSAERIQLKVPWSNIQIKSIMEQVYEVGRTNHDQETVFIFRLFISRGPGSFSPNPYDSIGSQLHVIMTQYSEKAVEKIRTQGVSICFSEIPPKSAEWAKFKTCNYLPNVLMKKESVDQGVDFSIGVDEDGNLTESSTENMMILTHDLKLLKPKSDKILQGTTMNRLLILAKKYVQEGSIKYSGESLLNKSDLLNASEAYIIGTTWDLLPITHIKLSSDEVHRKSIGPFHNKFLDLILKDQLGQ